MKRIVAAVVMVLVTIVASGCTPKDKRCSICNPLAPSCNYTLQLTGSVIPATGGNGFVTINTSAGCTWSASSNAPWIKISNANGTGSDTAPFTVDQNTGSERVGTITVNGQTVTVTQQAAVSPCAYDVRVDNLNFPKKGGGIGVSVATSNSCSWTATSSVSWIRVISGQSVTGSGNSSFAVDENLGSDRTGTIVVAGKTFTVNQQGTSSQPTCGYSVSPTTQSFSSAGGSNSLTVTTSAGCPWNASTSVSWITITSGSGSGSGTVPYTVSANTTTSIRNGSITVGGQTLTVTQAGATCSFALSPTTQDFPASGGSSSFAVTTSSGCTWNAVSGASWVSLASGSGNGSGTVSYTVSTNTGGQRSGTITVGGQTFTVTQQAYVAPQCTYVVAMLQDPTKIPWQGEGIGVSVNTQPGCSWTSSVSDSSWIKTVNGGGTGSGGASFTTLANYSTGTRTGWIIVAGTKFDLSQAGM